MPGSSENPVSNIVPDPEAMERFPGRDIPPGALMDSNIKYGSTGLTGGFHTSLPETPSSERTPLSFPTSQIPEDVIPKSSYMNAPGAVPTPASARENMNAQGVVPAARFGEQSAPGDVEMVGGPVSPGYGTNEYLPIPDASNIARATADEDRMYTGNQPRGHDMASRELALASPRENMKDQAARYRERLMSAPGLGDDTDSGPWWRQGLDYVRDNPDILINAAGRAIESRAQDEYYRRMAAVNEGNQRLRAQQLFYEQDPQRLREQQALSYRSRWQ
jgi:hypothetical protein